MALSGSFNGTTSNQYITPTITWSATQNANENYSTVTATLKYAKNSVSTESTRGTWSGTLTINGSSQSGTLYMYLSHHVDTEPVTAISYTVKVPHEKDGSKTITIQATGGIPGTSFKTTSISKSITLNQIPRASSIISASAVAVNNPCSVKWTPLSSSFAYKLQFSCNGITRTTGYIEPKTTSTYTYVGYIMDESTWSPAIGSTFSETCTVILYSYPSKSSSSPMGSDFATFQLKLPNSTQPSISNFKTTLINGWNGYYIQGKSQCAVSANFAPGTGSSFRYCLINGHGLTLYDTSSSLSGVSSVLNKNGTITYTAEVADGRATVNEETSIFVYQYANPKLNMYAERMSSGNPNMPSTQIRVTYDASCSSVNYENQLTTLSIYYKLADATLWEEEAYTISINASTVNDSIILNGFDSTKAYDFKATISDKVLDFYGDDGTTEIASAESEFRIFNISADKTGISIGKMSDGKIFDCNVPARFLKTIEFGQRVNGDYGRIKTDCNVNTANNTFRNIVYIQTGQEVEDGSTMGLAIHNQSVYVENEANTGKVNLGSGGRKWNQLYAANGTIATSDRKVKTDITNMSDAQEQLFNKLQPVTFKFNNGSSGRTHYGFVSQDVEDALIEIGLDSKDFAGFCKDLRTHNGEAVLDESGQKVYDYSLRYSEFIALNTYMIQKLQAENAELKAELQELKEIIVGTSSNNME